MCFHASHVLCTLVTNLSCAFFFWCYPCLVLYVLFCSPSFPCFRCFKSNILIWISCLIAFISWGSCAFGAWAIWVFMPVIIFIIFWDFLMFYQVFFPSQMKRCAIITYKHGIYELSHELPNELKLRILGN